MAFNKRFTLVGLIVVVMFVLHNSFWWWDLDRVLPLLFGFMPFAFSYYIGYAILAVVAMKLVTVLAWPDPPAEVLDSFTSDEENPAP